MKNNNNTITMVVIGVVALGLGFFGGMQYSNYQRTQLRGQFGGGVAGGFGGRMMGWQPGVGGNRMMGRNGARPVYGQIVSQDDKSITVKMNDGSSKIVILSVKTSINKASEATKEDLKTGDTVAVFGTENSDGSVTAQNVQLNPIMRGFQGTPGASPAAK